MKFIILISALLVFSACTTTVPLEMAPAQIQKLNVEGSLPLADRDVVIVKKDNSRITARVLSTTGESIVTNKGIFLYSDIKTLGLKEFDKNKTFATAGGIYVLAGLLSVLYITNVF